MYAKIENDVVVQYPYGITRLRNENPHVSFPVNFLDNPEAIDYGVVVVKEIPRPKKPGFAYSDIGPVLVDGVWTQVWEERRKGLDELSPADIHKVDPPEQQWHYALDAGPSWDGDKYVQTWQLVALSPIERRIEEYGAPERQIEFITEQGLEAWKEEVDAIKARHPKS